MLPACAKQDLIDHLKNTKRIHEKDLREGVGRTTLPDAIARKSQRGFAVGMAIRVSGQQQVC